MNAFLDVKRIHRKGQNETMFTGQFRLEPIIFFVLTCTSIIEQNMLDKMGQINDNILLIKLLQNANSKPTKCKHFSLSFFRATHLQNVAAFCGLL